MKTYKYLFLSVLIIGLLSSCMKDYDAPPLTEPIYKGKEANITIAKLKTLYKGMTDPTLIDVDYVVKAVVIGNDISGNIFKQLYIEDETGGINLGVDQNSVYTEYRVGQEVYVNLKGLYMISYGGQLQIGYDKTQANRIPWETFSFYVFKNKWPQVDKAVPTVTTLSSLNESMVNTLIKLENVYFADGGKLPFSNTDATTNRALKDGDGKSIIVRNSNYASFAADMLPEGGGTVVGVLSKFNADWQLYLRTKDDCIDFGQPIPGGGDQPDPTAKTYFKETFDSGDASARPFIAAYTGYDNKTVTYSDPTGGVSVRTTNGFPTPHLWYPASKDGMLVIENIDTSEGADDKLVLKYELTANLFDAGSKMNLNAMTVKVDGKEMSVPSQEVSNANGDNNKVYVITLKDIPAKKGLKIEFLAKGDLNTVGLRMDNISISSQTDDVIIIKPK